MPELKPGDKVMYMADLGHWHETDRLNEPVFDFVVARDGQPVPAGQRRPMSGDPVDSKIVLSRIDPAGKDPAGYIVLTTGQTVRPSRAKQPWPGVVREEIERTPREVIATVEGKEQIVHLFDESRSLVLDVQHPNGVVTLHLPLGIVAHDPSGETPHSYHLPEEARS